MSPLSSPFSRRSVLMGALALGGAALAGCASGQPTNPAPAPAATGAPTAAATAAPKGPAKKIVVSLIPILDVAPVYMAQAKGFFAEHGLEVEIVLGQGGAAIVPAVVGGSAQIGFSNNLSLLIGQTKNPPLRVVSPAVASTGIDLKDANTVVAKDPAIQSAKDLEGKTVSTNTLRGSATPSSTPRSRPPAATRAPSTGWNCRSRTSSRPSSRARSTPA